MSNQQPEDDFSGLTSFFFYVFLVHPATAWILRPGRFERKKSIMYAIMFLASLAAVKTGLEWNSKLPSHYATLQVTRDSSPLEIKRAYRTLSVQVHPDKNKSPNAAEEFETVKRAYDVLMDMELREVYNKFGQEGIDSNKRFDETQFFIELGIFYLTWGMLSFVLTLGKKSGDAFQWTATGLIVMLVVEIALMTSTTNPVPTSLFPTLTEYEIVWWLHSLFPAFMNGCRSLGSYLYVDLNAQTKMLLLALQEQNKDILLVLRDVQIGVQTVQVTGGSRLAASSAAPSTAEIPVGGGGAIPRVTPTGKIKELQDRLQTSNSNVTAAVNLLKGDGQKSSSLGFYAMIVGYIVVSYVFK